MLGRRAKGKQVTSLIEEFNYPKYGPGQMWETAADKVTAAGSQLHFRHEVVRILHRDGAAYAVVARDKDTGAEHTFECTHVISSMPMGALLRAMDPPVPDDVRAAADGLAYRDFMTVALVVPLEYSFPDTWIYIHDPDVQVGRVQNFGSWSPYMVKEGRTCLGLEFWVHEGDDMWSKSDAELIEQAKRELHHLGLVDPAKVEAGYVVRVPKAYPVYDDTYTANVDVLRGWIAAETPNVFPTGRNGMHRYNNQDHSMLTAMLSVENILLGDEARRLDGQRRGRVPRGARRPVEERQRPVATRRCCSRAALDAASARAPGAARPRPRDTRRLTAVSKAVGRRRREGSRDDRHRRPGGRTTPGPSALPVLRRPPNHRGDQRDHDPRRVRHRRDGRRRATASTSPTSRSVPRSSS